MKNASALIFFCAVTLSISAPGVFSAKADTIRSISQLDSALAPSATAGGNSGAAVFSPDGRYVAFASTAKNLAVTNQTAFLTSQFWPSFNVYLLDRASGLTTLVSVNAAGTGGANGDAVPTAVSTNGQFVLFESSATNLVANRTTGKGEVYLRDVLNGQTFLVSVNTNGAGGSAISRDSAMTPDGRYVVFASLAKDLVPHDTNGIFDVFIRDTVGGTSQLVSAGATRFATTNLAPTAVSASRIPSVTPDGRYVLFYSTATNLIPGVPAFGELFLSDTLSNTLTWVSAGAQGLYQNATPSNSFSTAFNGVISDDGSYVAYEASSASFPGPAYGYVLRYNVQSGFTDIVSTNAYVTPFLLPENEAGLDMTPDGRFISYVGNTGIPTGPGLPPPQSTNVFLWDAQSGSNTVVSVNTANGSTLSGESSSPALSADGRYVAFVSSVTNLTTNNLNGAFHLYRRDVLDGVTELVDTGEDGAGSGITPDFAPMISADGSLVAFHTDSANIASGDRNNDYDLFVRDFAGGSTELVSARDASLPSQTPNGLSGNSTFSVSGNGRYVAFASQADDLTLNDTNGVWDIYVRDLQNGTNLLVSVATNGFAANSPSFAPSISGNGRYVAFTSYASDIVAAPGTATENVYVRDLQAGTTTLVSVGLDGVSFGNSNSWQPTISADGRYVLFQSLARNLATPTLGTPTANAENSFLRDLVSNVTYDLANLTASVPADFSAAMTPDGKYVVFTGQSGPSNSLSNSLSVWNTQTASVISKIPMAYMSDVPLPVSISANGQKVAWWTGTYLFVADVPSKVQQTVATNFLNLNGGFPFSADGNLLVFTTWLGASGPNNVYMHNFQTGSNSLISHAYGSTAVASGFSDSPAISPDGRFVVFHSVATNLLAAPVNGLGNLYVYDGVAGATSLLTQNSAGTGPADAASGKPVFSSDGTTLVFQSWASDLTSSNDYNDSADIFSYAFPYLQITPGASPLEGPVLSWPSTPGQTYEVQYTDALNGAPWQNLPGTLSINAFQGVLSNTPPVSSQRFYRLVIQ